MRGRVGAGGRGRGREAGRVVQCSSKRVSQWMCRKIGRAIWPDLFEWSQSREQYLTIHHPEWPDPTHHRWRISTQSRASSRADSHPRLAAPFFSNSTFFPAPEVEFRNFRLFSSRFASSSPFFCKVLDSLVRYSFTFMGFFSDRVFENRPSKLVLLFWKFYRNAMRMRGLETPTSAAHIYWFWIAEEIFQPFRLLLLARFFTSPSYIVLQVSIIIYLTYSFLLFW